MEPYQDQIGQRLDDPGSVPAQYRHLIGDDLQRVQRILSIPVSGRVLDVGCSDGAITRRIAERWRVYVTGVDVWDAAPRSVDIPMGYGAFFDRRDIREPGGPLASFDVAYACEVLEHLADADVRKAVQNILALIRAGGDLVVTVPNRYCHENYVAGCRDRWKWADHRSVWHLWRVQDTLAAHFRELEFLPLYDEDKPEHSIWIICHAKGKL